MTIEPTTPPGTLELLPGEQAVHDAMLERIREGFRSFGFQPIETPVFERAEVLLTKAGGETERQVYYVQSAGDRARGSDPDLALRFDLTVPLARYVAEHEADLTFPFRRYQIQRVYRGERPQRGRFREFYQCDIDVIDRDQLSLRHDAEVAAAAVAILSDLGIGSVTLRLNDRRLMRRLLAVYGVDNPDAQVGVLREIDKRDRVGPDGVEKALVEGGMAAATASDLVRLTSVYAVGPDAIAAALADLPAAVRPAAEELRAVLHTMAAMSVPPSRYALDLSIARGLDYYTGTVYETTLDRHPELGSICSGGRYDDLAGLYTRTRLPGVGISIGFTRLFSALVEAGALPELGPVPVAVLLVDDADLGYALEVAGRLRAGGVPVESQLTPARLGKQLKAADRRRVRYAVIVGAEERERGTAALKDLRSGTQVEYTLDELVNILRDKGTR